jgi:hypothetical protein
MLTIQIVTPDGLTRIVQDFLSEGAVVLEDGAVAFDPLLYLIAPALHVQPTTDTLLRYISPEIEWEFVGIDERWREGVKGVFRKRPETSAHRGEPQAGEGPAARLRIAI